MRRLSEIANARRRLQSLIERTMKGSHFGSENSQLESYLFFRFYSLRKAGLSSLEASRAIAESSKQYGAVLSHIANSKQGIGGSADSDLPSKTYRWELLLNIRDGAKSRLLLMETAIRNQFRISATNMQTKLIILTFLLFVVPFSALVSWFYLFPGRSDLLALFFLFYPPFLSLISEWARMNNEELVH